MNIEVDTEATKQKAEPTVTIPVSEWITLIRQATYFRSIRCATESILSTEAEFWQNSHIAEIVKAICAQEADF